MASTQVAVSEEMQIRLVRGGDDGAFLRTDSPIRAQALSQDLVYCG